MDIRKVKKLIDLLESSGMAEIEIKEGEESVRIVKSGTTPVSFAPVPAPVEIFTHEPSLQAEAVTNIVEKSSGNAITSPMVGTFYSKPSPSVESFVNVGDTVRVGDVICIIEAMKIMNKIEADKSGVIARICLNDGDVVEFGQELVIIS